MSGPHRSGFVSLIGRPNAGKSTLLNALLGQKVAIVADKPQTTRTLIQGVLTLPEAQIAFLDTPGLHEPDTLFNKTMMRSVSEALAERDLIILVADVSRPRPDEDEKALALIQQGGAPVLLALNKIDKLESKQELLPLLEWYRQRHEFVAYVPLSARTGQGLDELRAEVLARLPEGPAFFPEDYLTDQPERYLAAELVREKVLALTRHEVPHSTAVRVDEWQEEGRLVRVAATIYVDRPGHKGILIGAGGSRLKQIGTEARLEMEQMFARKVFLQLFVKVQPGWRENAAFLNELDWRSMAGAETPRESEN